MAKLDGVEELLKAYEAKFEAMQKQIEELTNKADNYEDDEVSSKAKDPEAEAWINEKVPFYAIKDNDRYKDDIVVGVNGKNWVIQRGVHVNIPRFVYMAIIDAERQRGIAAMHSDGLADKFSRESKAQGL